MSVFNVRRRATCAVACLIAAGAVAPANAASQRCALALPDGGSVKLRFDERVGKPNALAMNFEQVVGASAHECSLGASRGDRVSRWRGTAPVYVDLNDPNAGRFLLSFYRYQGAWQIGVTAFDDGNATCGTFAVPPTIILTPKPDGRCVAKLPGAAAPTLRASRDGGVRPSRYSATKQLKAGRTTSRPLYVGNNLSGVQAKLRQR